MQNKLNKLQILNIIIFVPMIIACIVIGVGQKLSLLSIIACISGILYMVFLSDKNIFNFIIGFISTTTYIIIAFQSKLYGETIFYLFFDLPMIFISYFVWRKHKETKYTVYSRKLTTKNTAIICILSVIIIVAYGFLLKALGDVSPFVDATSTVVSFIATILMSLRYREQWIMWIIVYFTGILLWINPFNILMLLMAISCFISSFVGYINWSKTNKS